MMRRIQAMFEKFEETERRKRNIRIAIQQSIKRPAQVPKKVKVLGPRPPQVKLTPFLESLPVGGIVTSRQIIDQFKMRSSDVSIALGECEALRNVGRGKYERLDRPITFKRA